MYIAIFLPLITPRPWTIWGENAVLTAGYLTCICTNIQAHIIWKVDNAIHWIKHYPEDSVVLLKTYLLDSDFIQ